MAHRPRSCGFWVQHSRRPHPDQARRHMAKVSTQSYKVADDARVTPLSTEGACCGQLPSETRIGLSRISPVQKITRTFSMVAVIVAALAALVLTLALVTQAGVL